MTRNRGVYFIANNAVLDLTIAFLNSFRAFNPDVPLCFIPYNDDHSHILALQEDYQFDIFADTGLLRQCDEISTRFHGHVNGAYRKLAMWNGAFEEFAYIDVDTLVLSDITFAFRFLDTYPCLTSHSNLKKIRKFVWKASIYRCTALDAAQIAFSANTGFVVSSKSFMDMAEISGKVDQALAIREHMELSCQEQPFLNYLIVTAGKPYTSLHRLYFDRNVKKGIMLEKWAGIREGKVRDGQLIGLNRPVFLIHWAGLWQARKLDFMRYRLLKFLRLIPEASRPARYWRMRYKKLWQHYRNLRKAD